MIIGAPVASRSMEPEELNRFVEEWIEGQMSRIGGTAASSA
jgi:hypothetical protein